VRRIDWLVVAFLALAITTLTVGQAAAVETHPTIKAGQRCHDRQIHKRIIGKGGQRLVCVRYGKGWDTWTPYEVPVILPPAGGEEQA
jgi:hypothetical protein